MVSHFDFASYGIYVFAFVRVSEILRTTIAEHRVSVLLLNYFFLRSEHLRVLLNDHVLFLIGGSRNELLNRKLQSILQLLVAFDTGS